MNAANPREPQEGVTMPKPITWRGHTARYHRHERHVMRILAREHPKEAQFLHELKARLDATIRVDFEKRI